MKSKPIEGPWEQAGSVIFAPDAKAMVCELSEPHGSQYVEHKAVDLGSKDWQLAMATGQLIVAAPDLLEACERAATLLAQCQKAIENGDRTVVGVNKFIEEDEEIKIPILKIDKQVEIDQMEALERLKKERNDEAVKRSLDILRKAAEGTENTMPATLECVRNYVTEGEICDVFKEVFGEYQEKSII